MLNNHNIILLFSYFFNIFLLFSDIYNILTFNWLLLMGKSDNYLWSNLIFFLQIEITWIRIRIEQGRPGHGDWSAVLLHLPPLQSRRHDLRPQLQPALLQDGRRGHGHPAGRWDQVGRSRTPGVHADKSIKTLRVDRIRPNCYAIFRFFLTLIL